MQGTDGSCTPLMLLCMWPNAWGQRHASIPGRHTIMDRRLCAPGVSGPSGEGGETYTEPTRGDGPGLAASTAQGQAAEAPLRTAYRAAVMPGGDWGVFEIWLLCALAIF